MDINSVARGFFVSLALFLVSCGDTITLQNASGDVGVLVDGQENGSVVNDRGHVAGGSGDVEVNVAFLSSAAAPNRNEAIGFGEDRSTRRLAAPWTDSGDDFDLELGNRISVPVTVWIVQGPFGDQFDHAVDACIQTSVIWDAERVGIRFSAFDVKDATADPDIDDAIRNSTGGDSRNWDDFSDDIGFDEGRINIYWINTVDGLTTQGWSDFGARIVMGKNTGDELLAHEIGHAFSLRHPDACTNVNANFDQTNLMWPCSSIREFVAEGQIFRAHFNATSSINNLYGKRPGQPTVGCGDSNQTPECPTLERRLWADGTFPVN